jgi:hypothetical protein
MLAVVTSNKQMTGQSQSMVAKTNTPLQAIIGEVVNVDLSSKQIQVKKNDGSTLIVIFADNTVFSRVPPGEQTLKGAVKISPSEINKDDRLYARGVFSEDSRSVTARSVIIMGQADILQKQERERSEWRKRGIAGKVTAISLPTQEITLLVSTREGKKSITIEANSSSVRFRRYPSDSIKFDNTIPSSFSELKVGDQLRSLGERSANGARFKPEEIVFGSFRTLGGTVTAINKQTGEITINPISGGQPLIVTVGGNSMMRRILPEVASAIVRQVTNNTAAPKQTSKAVSSTAIPAANDSAVKSSGDLQEDIERSPVLNLAELKAGDMVLITTGNINQTMPVKAAVFLSGVESVLTLFKPQPNAKNTSRANLNTGLPLNALDGIGVQ